MGQKGIRMSRYGKCLDCGEAVAVNSDGLRSECACDRSHRRQWSRQLEVNGIVSFDEAYAALTRYWHSQSDEEECQKIQGWFKFLA